eukprot:TRINITY_DN7459_c0_g1_i1.p1 TRINITY_DN7459_c0_g1~~TRINITY_DN7459_c0_g1_i1.p1  ORF type:complete len:268 (+),score=71.89 TRINITY_DN7459_c0_g1_i1:9-812(+)
MTTQGQIYIITGGNRGIGKCIVEQLAAQVQSQDTLIFTSTNPGQGNAALADFKGRFDTVNIVYHQLNVTDAQSIESFALFVKDTFGRVDVLINNAGYAAKGNRYDSELARFTANINYFGVRHVTESLIPLFNADSRIINISSGAGLLENWSDAYQQRFLDPELTLDQLDALYEEVFAIIDEGTHEEKGLPNSTYKISKTFLNAYGRILYRDLEYFIASICPGWCRTDMGGESAHRSAEKGAETPVIFALRQNNESGKFWRDNQEINW